MSEGDQHVGATIAGKYRIRRLIGVGGMGYVYEGEHLELGKRVAIKIIDGAAETSAELAARFRREARAASAVESEGIVQVFDVGRDPEVGLYMVMELLKGEDLEHRLRKEPERRLDPVLVAQIGYQVARALVRAHGARVIHRDLKPANIFLTDRDDGSLRVKILDFGISKLLASEASIATSKDGLLGLTQAGVALGTPQYMSPEQAQGLTTVDHRCDVWGLGVVLYEALAGIHAFPELRSYQETILNLLRTPPQPLSRVAPWVPEALAKVVHAAIQHDVTLRIQSCAAFAARLEEAMPEVVSAATGPFTSVRLPRLSSPWHSANAVSIQQPAVLPVSPVSASSNEKPARPITLGDDTQVVVRPSDPSTMSDESDPSMTMLATDSVRAAGQAQGVRSAKGWGAKVEVRASVKAFAAPREVESAPLSTGEPTMFQSPAWVAQPDEGPGTLKTGLALAEAQPPTHSLVARQVVAAMMTALVVVVVGGSLLLLAQRGSPVESAGAAAVESPPSSGPAIEPAAATGVAPPIAAPPSTGTAAIPIAPVTEKAGTERADAAASTAAAAR
jgi:serine/threonine protein kinase